MWCTREVVSSREDLRECFSVVRKDLRRDDGVASFSRVCCSLSCVACYIGSRFLHSTDIHYFLMYCQAFTFLSTAELSGSR